MSGWPPVPPLSDEVVQLRPFQAEDIAVVTRGFGDPTVTRWFPVRVPVTEADIAEQLQRFQKRWNTRTQASFAIIDRCSGQLTGGVDLDDIEWPTGRGEIGYWLSPQWRGRGLAVRAVELVAQWALGRLGLAEVHLLVEPQNTASVAVARRCGFRFVQTLPAHDVDWRDQRARDFYQFIRYPPTGQDTATFE